MILLDLIKHVTDLESMLQHSPVSPGHALGPLGPDAAPPSTPIATPSTSATDPYNQIEDFLLNIVNFLQVISFSIFLLSVVIAGIMYMLSMNNDRHKAQATGAIVTAVVGLIITLLATGLHGLIANAFPH